eukprot:GILJ01009358.1.p1 GENE.GILJ01009358.1~~GILJ01009358.1.p1  ORF type:complete len:377 (-),score=32.54 GILJ01009358.1:488-1618(-)
MSSLLLSFGSGAGGVLGHGDEEDAHTPTPVKGDVRVLTVACGGRHCLALDTDDCVIGWGENAEGQLGIQGDSCGFRGPVTRPSMLHLGMSVRNVACGWSHSACISEEGMLFTWGEGRWGQLGHNSTEAELAPKRVEGVRDVAMVACGVRHTVCVLTDGSTYAWGANSDGQLGVGDKAKRLAPCLVEGLQGVAIASVAVGFKFTVWLSASGELYSSGNNAHGQLGLSDRTQRLLPTRINTVTARKVVCGWTHQFVLTDDGSMLTCGRNNFGQLGIATVDDSCCDLLPVPFEAVVTDIAGGSMSSVALTDGGLVYSWGWNEHGNLGHADTIDRSTPTLIQALNRLRVSQITAAGCVIIVKATPRELTTEPGESETVGS